MRFLCQTPRALGACAEVASTWGLPVLTVPSSCPIPLSCSPVLLLAGSLSVALEALLFWSSEHELDWVTVLVLSQPLLPVRSKTKSAGIVLGINKALSKQTPRERVSLVTAACVSLTACLGPHKGCFEARKRPFLDGHPVHGEIQPPA